MKLNINKIATILGIISTILVAVTWFYNYEKNLVKTSDLAIMDLDARIERTEILVAVYSRNPETLTEMERNMYERAKARLIQLESQRDKLLGVSND